MPPGSPAAASARLPPAGYRLLYLVAQPVSVPSAADCVFVYTGDVFRMVDRPAPAALLAGCLGDFRGDGREDLALLLTRERDGAAVPVVLRARPPGWDVIELGEVTDPYGFQVDRTAWPGPFCTPKPRSGVLRSEVAGDTAIVVGDLLTVGWRTYFWDPGAGRFDSLLTND
ncbi:MAG TPA: hypothetical protein VFL90_14535 [Methylomirabilota bacterium]|nr:hypothetical protein [Methylomirabilota bacterium]